MVVVEGGPKAQKRYRKLLMQRIDWGDIADEDEDDEDEDREARAARAACAPPIGRTVHWHCHPTRAGAPAQCR